MDAGRGAPGRVARAAHRRARRAARDIPRGAGHAALRGSHDARSCRDRVRGRGECGGRWRPGPVGQHARSGRRGNSTRRAFHHGRASSKARAATGGRARRRGAASAHAKLSACRRAARGGLSTRRCARTFANPATCRRARAGSTPSACCRTDAQRRGAARPPASRRVSSPGVEGAWTGSRAAARRRPRSARAGRPARRRTRDAHRCAR